MNERSDIQNLFADVQQAAAIIDVSVNETVVKNLLSTYAPYFLEAFTAFRVTTKTEQELSVRYLSLKAHDPYTIAVGNNFIIPAEHPVYAVIPTLLDYAPDAGGGIDFGVSHGLEKIWTVYTTPLSTEEVCAMEIMPVAIRDRVDLFKKHGLNWISVIGVDYLSNSINLYWFRGSIPTEPDTIAALTDDFGFATPPDDEMELNATTFNIYPTFTWESDKIERLSFGMGGPQDAVPTHWPDPISRFAAEVPLQSNERLFTFNTCYYPDDRPSYYKLEADYRAVMPNLAPPVLEGVAVAQQTV